ncbi:alpha/beta hydrolase [Paraflavisolibacter sp. H34]|uniref:alpha/beta fold hydrolase n=1 Tax=Huijunlia imazamoxiresistens TaxID=3127457 RepID=UPI0030186347
MKKYILLFLLVLFARAFTPAQAQAQPRALGLELENFPYPYPVHFLHLTLQGQPLKMAYMDVRPARPNGHTVVLLHGKNFSGAYWDSTARSLSANGYRVILPDQVGFGKSSKPAHLQYSFPLLARNTALLLDSLQINKVAVLGHSMGGMLAARFALMYPERVEQLILENPLGLEDYKLNVPYQTVDEFYKSELKQDAAKIKAYQLENYYGGRWQPQYDKWVNMLAGWTLNPKYGVIAWNAALTYDMILTQPVYYELDRIQAPTLLIIGQRDRTSVGKALAPAAIRPSLGNYPELGRTTQQRIKGATLVAIDNVGHLPHIESFDKFIGPLLDFLKK